MVDNVSVPLVWACEKWLWKPKVLAQRWLNVAPAPYGAGATLSQRMRLLELSLHKMMLRNVGVGKSVYVEGGADFGSLSPRLLSPDAVATAIWPLHAFLLQPQR